MVCVISLIAELGLSRSCLLYGRSYIGKQIKCIRVRFKSVHVEIQFAEAMWQKSFELTSKWLHVRITCLFEFGRKKSFSPTMHLRMCTSLLQEYYWETMSVMNLNIHTIFFNELTWTWWRLQCIQIYRYFRLTMKTRHICFYFIKFEITWNMSDQ